MQEEKRSLYHLYDALERIMEAASQNQNDIQGAINAINFQISKLEKTTNKAQAEVESSISDGTQKVVNSLIQKFRKADEYATRATETYKSVSFWSPILFFLVIIFSGGVVLSGFTKILLMMIPSEAEIEKKFEEKKQLDLLISENDVTLSYCGDRKRRCVKVNKNELDQRFGDNGEAYVILDGH